MSSAREDCDDTTVTSATAAIAQNELARQSIAEF